MFQEMSYDTLRRNYYKLKKESVALIKLLIENCPDTYSGTDIERQQQKMFLFQGAVYKAEEFIKEYEENGSTENT